MLTGAFGNKCRWNCNCKRNIFIQENSLENLVKKMSTTLVRPKYVNPVWISDAICRYRSGSILAQVMGRCLTAPRHCLNQCWLERLLASMPMSLNSKCKWYAFNNYHLELIVLRFFFRSATGQWVNSGLHLPLSITVPRRHFSAN